MSNELEIDNSSDSEVLNNNNSNKSDKDEMAKTLAKDLLKQYRPHINRAENAIQELITKQNKIYVDISAEKFQYCDNDIHNVSQMMEDIRTYQNKLVKMKKQMISIHRRTNTLKTKCINIQNAKDKEKLTRLR